MPGGTCDWLKNNRFIDKKGLHCLKTFLMRAKSTLLPWIGEGTIHREQEKET